MIWILANYNTNYNVWNHLKISKIIYFMIQGLGNIYFVNQIIKVKDVKIFGLFILIYIVHKKIILMTWMLW